MQRGEQHIAKQYSISTFTGVCSFVWKAKYQLLPLVPVLKNWITGGMVWKSDNDILYCLNFYNMMCYMYDKLLK